MPIQILSFLFTFIHVIFYNGYIKLKERLKVEKIIEIDINNKADLLEKYNNTKISKELIEYLINESSYINKKDNIIIKINNNTKLDLDIVLSLKKALEEEYNNTIKSHIKNDIVQIIFFFLGLFFLFLSTKITSSNIWKEILLIGGWVFIWEMIDLELFNDFRGRKRKRILQRLIASNIIIN